MLMKTLVNTALISLAALLLFAACGKNDTEWNVPDAYKDAFSASAPTVGKELTKVSLSEGQDALVDASNSLAFNMLDKLYAGKSMIASPLSLYMSLGMAVNGADGSTRKELLDLLGGDTVAVNAFAKSLLEQLPAVDLESKVRLADAVVLNDRYKLQGAYKTTVENSFYAPVESIPFSDPELVANLVNSWCNRQTEGLIPDLLKASDITPDLAAILLNALYFKAKWTKPFEEYQVSEHSFSGLPGKIDFLNEQAGMGYVDKGGYHVVSLDYSNGKYKFYILLPKAVNGLKDMLGQLQKESWKAIAGSMKYEQVLLRFPKFKTSSEMHLKQMLTQLGVTEAFKRTADFSAMLENGDAFISDILQKATISVNEYGTEAAAVTAVMMAANAGPGQQEPILFVADHPFAYVIAESSSNTILFSGIFDGKE